MSGDLGSVVFLPWLRRGISAHIRHVEGAPLTGRADLQVVVTIGGGPESAPVEVSLQFLGPGDVGGFDARSVSRHWPRADVFEVEPNYFPLLELSPADLAWRYTPAAANAQNRLSPWLALIVLRDAEIAGIDAATATRAHPVVHTKPGTPLPAVDELWAWAHVHVDGAATVDPTTLRDVLDHEPQRVVARLLCPRRLEADTAYTAFLVPTFEATRRSALGLPPDPSLDAMTTAWRNDGAAADLPIFYRWHFETSDGGDFASLAARIVARTLPPTAGTRPMDESAPGMGLPAAATEPLAVESALGATDAISTPWPTHERQTWSTALAGLVNLPERRLQQAGAPRTLAPPLYARWHAAVSALDPAAPPPWFQDLNADPRLRTASALGWAVVQRNQPQLLASAWAQVEGIRDANAKLRQAQLAREAATRLYRRDVVGRPDSAIALLTRALHTRVLATGPSMPAPGMTVAALIRRSPLRLGVTETCFRRISRPLGPVGVRQGRPFQPLSATLARLNVGDLRVAPAPPTPTVMVTAGRAAADIAPAWLTPAVAATIASLPSRTADALDAAIPRTSPVEADRAGGTGPAGPRPTRNQLEQFLGQLRVPQGVKVADDLQRRLALRSASLTAVQIASAPPRPGFVARELLPDGTLPAASASAAPEDTRFRTAVASTFADLNVAPAAGDTLAPIDVAATASALSSAIDPRTTVGASLGQRLNVAAPRQAADPLEPVMAAPAFPQPLYRPLYEISADWILAGFDDLAQDSATVARVNERFIEAFLAGANDEMGRTLLFNEYPTDQRGSYFRQFWDVSAVEQPLPDINPIAAWPKTAALGSNSSRPTPDALVLLVRAELLRRYPNLVVYAVKAEWDAQGTRRVPATDAVEKSPDFSGTLGAGAAFWGFPLSKSEARGAASEAEGDAGWYLALQEHPSEPRFGLAPPSATFGGHPTSTETLAWSDLAADAGGFASLDYITLAGALPNLSALTDAGGASWHVADGVRASDVAYLTYREPSRLLIHASRMIPSDAV